MLKSGFSVRATLKIWEWAWGQGYELIWSQHDSCSELELHVYISQEKKKESWSTLSRVIYHQVPGRMQHDSCSELELHVNISQEKKKKNLGIPCLGSFVIKSLAGCSLQIKSMAAAAVMHKE